MIEKLYNKLISLDTLFLEHEEWCSRYELFQLHKRLDDGSVDEDDESQIVRIIQTVEEDILSTAEADSITESRNKLFKMRALLNEYSTKVGSDFLKDNNTEDMDAGELEKLAFDMFITGENR